MDTGVFRRSKIGVLAWLLGPPLLIGLLNYVAFTYAQLIDHALIRERQLAAVIPQIEQRVDQAETLTKSFSRLENGQVRTVALLTTLFNERAGENRFEIHSISTSNGQTGSGRAFDLTLRVRAEAALPDFIACLDALQRDDRLFNAAVSDLKITSLFPAPRYVGTFVLGFHGLPASVPPRVTNQPNAERLGNPKGTPGGTG